MKNYIALILFGLLIISCGTTQEAEKPVVSEELSTRQNKQMPKKSLGLDAEQLVAKLNLSEEQEEAFLNLWNTTSDSMREVRIKYRGDRDALRDNMMSVRKQRNDGIKSILNEDQYELYNHIIIRNRKKIGAKRKGVDDN